MCIGLWSWVCSWVGGYPPLCVVCEIAGRKQKACCGLSAVDGFGHQGGQASRCPPYETSTLRRVDDAFFIHHLGGVYLGCVLGSSAPQLVQTTWSSGPVRRLSVSAVERGVWHGCQTRHAGPWMARLAYPRNSAGARGVERSETRMPGALSLWLLSLSREQRENNSP